MIKKELKKYSQRLNLGLALSGGLIGVLPVIREDLGSYYGLIFVATSLVSAWCVAQKQNLNAN